MTKISLVQLSQMKNKPKKVILNDVYFILQNTGYYENNNFKILQDQIRFEDFNEPLIEIVEEFLTSDEKEYLKNLIKYCDFEDVIAIRKAIFTNYINIYLENYDNESCYRVNKKYFKELTNHKEYKISDLGLYDE